jgi:hypothetical protein
MRQPFGSRVDIVSPVARLWARHPRNLSLISGRGDVFLSSLENVDWI